MEPASKKPKISEDPDVNCRLRHGLNVHCLAHIFQCLDSPDLYEVGGMNEFYKQIINDLVIPKHEVNFEKLYERSITIPQVFERYGTNIRKIDFNDEAEINTTEQLIQSITQYCSTDQLKSVKIDMNFGGGVNQYTLPIQLQKVEKLEICGFDRLSVQLSESVRYLRLDTINLDRNFDWTKLENLTELYLDSAYGINVQNFIEFLQHRPNIEVFYHDKHTFGGFTRDICDAMAKYCGNQIRDYSGQMPNDQANLYDFISGFKNVKKVGLTSDKMGGVDLIDSMKRLAKNDTIETLHIAFSELGAWPRLHSNRILQIRSNHEGLDMGYFSHLKAIKILGRLNSFEDFDHGFVCDPFKLLSVYSSQILSNVENLTIESEAYDWSFIKFAPKLRHLGLHIYFGITQNQAAKVVSTLEIILRARNNGQTRDDFIEIQFDREDVFKMFDKIDGRSDSIKLLLSISK